AKHTPRVVSLVAPGGGQMMNERWVIGILFQVLLTLLFAVLLGQMVYALVGSVRTLMSGREPDFVQSFSPMKYPGLAMLAVYLWNVIDIFVTTRKTSKPVKAEGAEKP
ncbi:MAG: hypothetical protein AAF492_06245, partial [Verrucomicrobiota bacterium]